MKRSKWDEYFHSHYNPLTHQWGEADLKKYKNWYYSWIEYIVKIPAVKTRLKKKTNGFEIGSAIGGTTALLKEKGIHMIGSDISREIVKKASLVHKSIRFVFCDIQRGIPGRKKFDFIFAFEVLEHLKKPSIGLKNIHSSLRPRGIFIASTPFPFPKAYTDPTHCSVMYPDEWKEIFQKAGFSKVTTRPMSFIPFIWKLSKFLNPVIPFYVPLDNIVSTTLIIAEK